MSQFPSTRVLEDLETVEKLSPLFHLILLDDDHHTYQYVIAMLGDIFGYGPEKAFAMACVLDGTGQAIVMTGPHDEVRSRQEKIHGYGADPHLPTSQGSMSAVIEPVE
jgi:ATP-dependent Clp protease adaptor protein ClpS